MIRTISLAVGVFAASSFSAQALNTRTFLSGAGSDAAGCGPIASPCRTLQYAHDNTAAGGEIAVRDSAGYGSLIITKAISVISEGTFAGATAASGGNAITINAGASDTVIMRGLTIEGAGVGANGVVFNSGGTLDIANCVVQNFLGAAPTGGNGILIRPASGTPKIFIANTTASHNSFVGVYYLPQSGSSAVASIVVDRVTTTRNSYGIAIVAASTGATYANLSNSLAADNDDEGFRFDGPLATAVVDLSSAIRNGTDGILVVSGAVTIGRSVSANNAGYGLNNTGGTVSSFGDNRFSGNTGGQTSGVIGAAMFK